MMKKVKKTFSLKGSRRSTSSSDSPTQEPRQKKLLEKWSIKFASAWAAIEMIKEKLEKSSAMQSFASDSEKVLNFEEDFIRTEEVVQMTVDEGKKVMGKGRLWDENRKKIQEDIKDLLEEWEKVKRHRSSGLVSRY